MTVTILALNMKGILGGATENVGYQPLSGIANKNGYSLYCLPAVLLSAYVLLNVRQSVGGYLLHGALILSSCFILFSGANRSGWVGVLLIKPSCWPCKRAVGRRW